MPSRVKELTVKEAVERYRSAGALVAVDYPGVSAEEAAEFRRGLREKRIEFHVVRKTLARIAFDELGIKGLGEVLDGRIALVSADDVVEVSKAAAALDRERKFAVKGGWAEGRPLSSAEVKALATIPSRKALMAQIAGLAAGPLRALMAMVGAPAASFARALKAWNEKREKAEEPGVSAAGDAQ